jgi:lipopolysaccharide transport system permease protein
MTTITSELQRGRGGPYAAFAAAWRHRQLTLQLTRREVEARFRGSLLGKLWAALLPLYMLGLYTFVFGFVFQARWPEAAAGGKLQVALLYFVGLILYEFLVECIGRGPTLMLENVSYIKKVVFPLDILAWVAVGGALFRVGVSSLMLLVFFLVLDGLPPPSALAAPLVVPPLALIGLGCLWFLSAMGVYLRDLRHGAALVAPALMFLSPIFFPLSAVPEPVRTLLYLNPLTPAIEMARGALFLGQWPDWGGLALYTGIGLVFAWAGHAWFMSVRRGFADVV